MQIKQSAYKFLVFLFFSAAFTAGAQTDVLHLKSDVVDTIFGKVVPDPYRWMENMESDSVKQWLKEQKKMAKAEEGHFNGRMYESKFGGYSNSSYQYTFTRKTGGRYFSWGGSQRFLGGSWVLYSRRGLDENYKVAFDPSVIDWTKTYSITRWAASDSGRYLAVVLLPEGGEWQEIRVRDLDSMEYYNDVIEHVKVNEIAWWGNGFFYSLFGDGGRWDTIGKQKLYYHQLGQKQDKDQLITSTPSGTNYQELRYWLTSNNRYLVIGKTQKIGTAFYAVIAYKDLNDGTDAALKHIVQKPVEDSSYYDIIDYADSGFLLSSNYKAPNGRVLLADMNEANHFYEVVRENDMIISQVSYVHHLLITLYYTGGKYAVCMYNNNGGLINGFKFPSGTSVEGFGGSPDDSETIFYEYSFYAPPVFYRYNFIAQTDTPLGKTRVGYNVDNYTSEIIHYKAKDGTDIPMYITYKKGINLKGNNPVILAGYGGFGLSARPFYRYSNIVFFESGGILAVPMIRGGGEEGANWHAAGRRLNKQTSFDDFVSAAEYLKNEGYTSKDKLAIEGSGNGGLLVTAVMLQHPGLCRAVVAQSGVYDMLRYQNFTYGKYWKEEYGNPDSIEDFKNLLSYSPLHNLKKGINYPAALFIAGRNDERVAPMHTCKFLARLQECSTGDNPHILFFEEDSKHGSGTGFVGGPEESFVLAFIFTQMHLPVKYLF